MSVASITSSPLSFLPGALPATESAGVGVPTLHRTVVEFANFDHGATAPALTSVAQAVNTALRTYGSVHRGAGYASRITTAWYEEARRCVADFVGARADDLTIFTRNTTDAFAILANALPDETQVYVFSSAHHAALLGWPDEQTHRLPIPHSHDEAISSARAALAQRDPSRPALLVITGACNVSGEIWPIAELAGVAAEFGARSVLDAAQLAPHRQVDIEGWDVDYVAISGHKLYAPYGSGALVGRADWLDAADPYFRAGGASLRVGETETVWNVGPARHEGGTPNAIGAFALAAAATALSTSRAACDAHESQLHDIIRHGLSSIPGVEIVSLFDAEENTPDNVGVTTFTIEGYDPTLVAQILADEYGIAVRDGRFCAHLLCDARVGSGSTAVRASIGLASTREHAHRLVRAVEKLVTDGPAFEYRHVPGVGWEPVEDPRILSEPRPW